jgi:DNA invertase Pin-like site-specific DNA recombinase
MMNGKRAAIYTRMFQAKILDKQPEVDIERCKAHCLTSNYIITNEHIYYEQTAEGEAELQRLLEAARKDLIDIVVITGPGRLSSSPADLITILEQFKAVGVRVETVDPSFLDGLLNNPPGARYLPARYNKKKKRSHWTEYAINGNIATSESNGAIERAAIYAGSFRPMEARVQIERLKARCNGRGYSLKSEHIYYDTQQDVNGSYRPELKRLLEVARNGSIDVVVLNNVQDFSQRPSYLIEILQTFQDTNVRVETIE